MLRQTCTSDKDKKYKKSFKNLARNNSVGRPELFYSYSMWSDSHYCNSNTSKTTAQIRKKENSDIKTEGRFKKGPITVQVNGLHLPSSRNKSNMKECEISQDYYPGEIEKKEIADHKPTKADQSRKKQVLWNKVDVPLQQTHFLDQPVSAFLPEVENCNSAVNRFLFRSREDASQPCEVERNIFAVTSLKGETFRKNKKGKLTKDVPNTENRMANHHLTSCSHSYIGDIVDEYSRDIDLGRGLRSHNKDKKQETKPKVIGNNKPSRLRKHATVSVPAPLIFRSNLPLHSSDRCNVLQHADASQLRRRKNAFISKRNSSVKAIRNIPSR